MATRLVTVFGGSGFVGQSVVQRLAASGARVRVAVRRPNEGQYCKPMGDVGQVQVVYADVTRPESVALAVRGSDAVINLVGILFERGHNGFEAVHTLGAANVARACVDADVPVLVHMSALGIEGVDAGYARSKVEGEKAVREIFPDAVVIKPSVIFGPDDSFFNKFGMLNKWLPVLPMAKLGTRYQPVYVGDVADAIVNAAAGAKGVAGETFCLGGPEVMTLKEILDLVQAVTMVKKPIVEVPTGFLKMKAFFLGLLTWPVFFEAPILTMDQVNMMGHDSIVPEKAKGLKQLGVAKPENAAAVVPSYLYRFRKYGQFAGA